MKYEKALIFENGVIIKTGDMVMVQYNESSFCLGRIKVIEEDIYKAFIISIDASEEFNAKVVKINPDKITQIKLVKESNNG